LHIQPSHQIHQRVDEGGCFVVCGVEHSIQTVQKTPGRLHSTCTGLCCSSATHSLSSLESFVCSHTVAAATWSRQHHLLAQEVALGR
jgi:hypothetical protein